jgi:tetratricopeptide (TPR) repeat protein
MKPIPFYGCLLIGLFLSLCTQAKSKIPPDFSEGNFKCDNKIKGHDYRVNDKATNRLRRQVEGAHFTISVQKGLRGNSGSIEADLEYVLNKFPNHPKALLVAANNQLKPGYLGYNKLRRDRKWPKKECYFRSAILRAPDDPVIHLVIAIFYHQQGNLEVAARHYKNSIEINPNNPEAQYNYGLLLLDNDEHQMAMKHAEIAYRLGYPLEGLKNRLVELNAWDKE